EAGTARMQVRARVGRINTGRRGRGSTAMAGDERARRRRSGGSRSTGASTRRRRRAGKPGGGAGASSGLGGGAGGRSEISHRQVEPLTILHPRTVSQSVTPREGNGGAARARRGPIGAPRGGRRCLRGRGEAEE